MKKCLFFLCGLLLIVQITVAQPEPVSIQFVEAQPLWEHLTWDTSFYEIGDQPDINKYTVVLPSPCFRFGDDLFLLNTCTNHRRELFGYIFERLDIYTGDVKWQNYSTYYNGGIQDYYKNLFLRPDGKIELSGVKSHGEYTESVPYAWNLGGRPSSYVRKIFDAESGTLLQAIIGQDSLTFMDPFNPVFYLASFDSMYLALRLYGTYIGSDTAKYGCEFYRLDDHQNLTDDIPFAYITYETTDTVTTFSFGQPSFIHLIDDTTIVCLLIKDKRYPEKTEAQLIWIDISDLDNVAVKRRVEVGDFLGPNRENLYMIFEYIGKLIFISQPYYHTELQRNVTYLTAFDTDGNLVHFLPVCEEHGNVYSGIFPFFVNNEVGYYAGFPSRTGRKGFDILKMQHGDSEFEFVSSLTSAVQDEEFTRQLAMIRMYDDGIFIIGAYTKKNGPVQNSAVKFYAFNADDLGINLSTSASENTLRSHILVYPNPTQGYVNIGFVDRFSGCVRVYDILGKLLVAYDVLDTKNCVIGLKGYSAGIYFIGVSDARSGLMYTAKVVYSP